MSIKRAGPLVAAMALTATTTSPGMADPRRGLASVHQPVVIDGRAYAPACPDWSDSDRHASEAQSFNFGCATASNLAAMIADPADLIHGRASVGPDAESAMKAIKSWREKPPTGAAGIDKVSSKDR